MGRQSELLGVWAEGRIEKYLTSKGMHVVDTRYASRFGEIDLVFFDGDVLVFGEVKYRSSLAYGTPLEAVTPDKQRKLRLCARQYLSEKGTEDCPCRFDVIALWKENGRFKVRHIKNAF